ncbi:hypothetical protein CsSME_00053924 [Camellia sinensis var. sinensis]
MALKVSHSLTIILWLSLLLFFIFHHGWSSNFSHLSPSLSHHNLSNRRALTEKFNFTPFMRHHHHRRHMPATGSEIDPRYGAEKRLVPTGPNPLHH